MSEYNNGYPISWFNVALGQNFIKYDRLYAMCMQAFYGKTNATEVDIYIDMMSMIKMLYNKNYDMLTLDQNVVASAMINLCAHLRDYFYSRHRVYATIYIVYAKNRPVSAVSLIPDYNAHFITTMNAKAQLSDLIETNCNILELVCPYLKDIYFIRDQYFNETSVVIYDLIKRTANDEYRSHIPKIVYSKDKYAYQLVAVTPKTFMFRPKKDNGMDCSFVITKSTIYDLYRSEHGLTQMDCSGINHGLFSLMLALSGLKSRSIPMLINNTKALKNIKSAIDDSKILNGYMSSIYIVPTDLGLNSQSFKLFYDRFNALDLITQHDIYINTPASVDNLRGIINLYNPDEVRELNNKYFQTYPLDLNRL